MPEDMLSQSLRGHSPSSSVPGVGHTVCASRPAHSEGFSALPYSTTLNLRRCPGCSAVPMGKPWRRNSGDVCLTSFVSCSWL